MERTYTSRVELNREFRTLHILYFLNSCLSAFMLVALFYIGAYFTDGTLEAAFLYTGGFLLLNYGCFCVYRHVTIWKDSRVALDLMNFSEESEGWGNIGHA